MPFTNRVAAGRDLARALAAYKGDKPIVMALPRGGVPVAAVVATALDAPLGKSGRVPIAVHFPSCDGVTPRAHSLRSGRRAKVVN